MLERLSVIRVLERYVLLELLRTFALTLIAITFVFVLGTVFRLMKDELTYLQILRVLPYAVAYTFPYLVPMAFLVALTLSYGRLVADREVLALESCGIPARALATPAIVLAVILSLASLLLQAEWLPYCHQKKSEIERAVLEEVLSLGEGGPWTRVFKQQGFDIYVRHHKGPLLEGVVLHMDVEGQPTTITAERGNVRSVLDERERPELVLELANVSMTRFSRNPDTFEPDEPIRGHFDSYVHRQPMGGGGRTKTNDYSTWQLRELVAKETDARRFAGACGLVAGAAIAVDDRLEGVPAEMAMRAAVATAPLIFLAIGFPLTIALRDPNRLVPFVYGIAAVSAFYFGPMLVGRTLSEEPGGWPLWCFLGDATSLVAAAGFALLARRMRR
ncbi:LptF/LptG family permease [bacterium]|nr:LptF/LptG family permease [bacterium]